MTDGDRVRPPWWLKATNKVMMIVSRLGVAYGKEGPAVLTVPGRKSGIPRSTPVTPMTVAGKCYVVAGFPGADWVENVRAAGEVTLARGRRSERLRLVALPPDQARPILRAFPAQVPTGVRVMKRCGLIAMGSPDELEAMAGRFVVFRFEPA
ncbi:deazaflavin-dependent nitroreductase [Mycobacterium kansasii]|uniref:nitroreductase family deazaflavin-dependent oxidoreductase n=1 Tax=Mycobacterium kansasii TaxID=1768 RepID=UPI0007B5037A|nr:nitroreductase family deazaflavin-dependent oxidoreductase [Mycobacterium kansasii]KZS75987.1 deazaflavin-dependent nitroreductase [Mycobacterium kansasii]